MPDQEIVDRVLQQIDRGELVELGKSLIRIPSLIGEETAAARWVANRRLNGAGSRPWPS